MSPAEQLYRLLADLEQPITDLQILHEAIIDAIDRTLPENFLDQIGKINCFTTCAMRYATLLEESRANLLEVLKAAQKEARKCQATSN